MRMAMRPYAHSDTALSSRGDPYPEIVVAPMDRLSASSASTFHAPHAHTRHEPPCPAQLVPRAVQALPESHPSPLKGWRSVLIWASRSPLADASSCSSESFVPGRLRFERTANIVRANLDDKRRHE